MTRAKVLYNRVLGADLISQHKSCSSPGWSWREEHRPWQARPRAVAGKRVERYRYIYMYLYTYTHIYIYIYTDMHTIQPCKVYMYVTMCTCTDILSIIS